MSVVDNVDECKKGIFFGAASSVSNNKAYPGPEYNTLDEVKHLYLFTIIIIEIPSRCAELSRLFFNQRVTSHVCGIIQS